MRRLLAGLPLVPLLLSGAPRSFLAHDEGYYALQARWALESREWLTPLWLGAPAFDRTMTVQWLIALAYRLVGIEAWAAHLPGLLAAVASLWLTQALARELAPRLAAEPAWPWLSTLLLACTPLWINYTHLATQDLPLLAVLELAVLALLRSAGERPHARRWAFVAGACLGLGFLLKSFLVLVPLLALAPYLLIERRELLRRPALWLGVLAGSVPGSLWLALALQAHGLAVVSGLWLKLIQLSGSDHFQPSPFFYFWNLPANTAPWIVAAGWGWWSWSRPRERGGLARAERLLLLAYPLVLLLLLSAFRTKTPYYPLLLTPWLAMAAAAALLRWSRAGTRSSQVGRWLLASLGGGLLLAGLALPRLVPDLGDSVAVPLPLVGAACLALGSSWCLLPLSRHPRQRLAAVIVGPWLALVLLVQGGLFSDRTPALRRALEQPELRGLLRTRPIALILSSALQDGDQEMVILLGLATPQLQSTPIRASELKRGQLAWSRTIDLVGTPPDRAPRSVLESPPAALGSWRLVSGR